METCKYGSGAGKRKPTAVKWKGVVCRAYDYSDSAISLNDPSLIPGEKVRVIKGPLSGLQGELVTVDGKTKVAVRIAALGFACVEMPIGYIEKLNN